MGRIKDKIKEFTEYTTIHGVGRLSASKGFWQRFLWIACLLGALGILSWQMSRLFRRYLEKPAIVDIRVHVEELDFPAVTICNVNQFRRSQLSRDEYLDAAFSSFAEALESQIFSSSTDNKSSNDSSSAGAEPKTARRKRAVAWDSFAETYEAITTESGNTEDNEANYYDTLYDEGTGDVDKDADEIPDVHIRKKRAEPGTLQNDMTVETTIGTDKPSTSSSNEAATIGPEDATTTETNDHQTTNSAAVSTTVKITEGATTTETHDDQTTHSTAVRTTEKITEDATTTETHDDQTTDSTSVSTIEKITEDATTTETHDDQTTDSTSVSPTVKTTEDATTMETHDDQTTDSTSVSTIEKITEDATTTETLDDQTTDSTSVSPTVKTTEDATTMETHDDQTTDSTAVSTTEKITEGATTTETHDDQTTDSTSVSPTVKTTEDATTMETHDDQTTDSTSVSTIEKITEDATTTETHDDQTTDSTSVSPTVKTTEDATTMETHDDQTTDSTAVSTTEKITEGATTTETHDDQTTDSTSISPTVKITEGAITTESIDHQTTDSAAVITTVKPAEDAITTETIDHRTSDSPEVSTTVKPAAGSISTETRDNQTKDGPGLSKKMETTENKRTDSTQATTALALPRATDTEKNYSPADDYYIPKVNLTGKDWFTAGSDNALVASSENLTRIVAQMDLETRREYGHQVVDFIQECTYNGKTCSPLNFTGLNHHRYGNCYTFNAGANDQAILKSSKPGPLYGFTVTLYIEQQEYVEALSPAAGIRVLIHSQDVQPFPEEEGIDVSPGQKTSISITMTRVDRLRYPYNSNCTDGTDQKIMYNKNYSVAACLRTCSQRHKMDVCKCGDPSLPIVGNASVCNETEQIVCIQKIDRVLDVGAVRCQCPPKCRETSYSTTISASDWPGKTFERVLKKQFSRRDPKLREALKNYTLRENFMKIEVYFKELTYQKLQEVPAYELENLLGDIGGQLGLWLGISILTLFEVIELVFKLCNIFPKKQASVGTQTAKPENKPSLDRHTPKHHPKRWKFPMKHGVGFDAMEYEMRLTRVY